MKIVYLTGASGFIGKHLTETLSPYFQVIPIPHHLITRAKYKDFHSFVFLSGYGNHYQQKDFEETYTSNMYHLFTTLRKIRDRKFKTFIHISTSSVTLPQQTVYSATKLAGEILVDAFAKEFKLPAFSVRPYSIFGEGEADSRFIPTIIRNHVEGVKSKLDPEPVHDWVYVKDFADAILYLIKSKEKPTAPVSVGYGLGRKNSWVYANIEDIMKKSHAYDTIKGMRSYDNQLWFKQGVDGLDLIGWAPKIGFEEGLKRTVKFYTEKYDQQTSQV